MNVHELDGWVGNLNDLNGLTNDEIARALYVGYEVESEFKVGDWVYHVFREKVGIVTYVDDDYVKFDGVFNGDFHYFRHATPEEIAKEKERRWWQKHYRDVWEIKLRDLLTHKRHKFVREIIGIQDGEYITNPNNERFTKQEIQGLFNIACFAE